MSWLDVLLSVVGVGYVLARRVMGQLLEIKALLVLPIVLTGIGISQLRHVHHVDAAVVAFVGLGVVVSVGLGLVRGRTVHLGNRGGELWMRYTVASVVLWVVNIVLKVVLWPVEHVISPAASTAAGNALLLSIGLGILAESAVVLLRAMSSDATVAWTKGEHGAPHQTSPAFERARSAVRDAGSVTAVGKRLQKTHHDW